MDDIPAFSSQNEEYWLLNVFPRRGIFPSGFSSLHLSYQRSVKLPLMSDVVSTEYLYIPATPCQSIVRSRFFHETPIVKP